MCSSPLSSVANCPFSVLDTCFLLINARILDFPIVYASAGFSKLTGFSRIEVLQKPGLCPFMHGPQTNKDDLRLFDVALKELKFEQAELILYKKNCESKFANQNAENNCNRFFILVNARWISMRLVPIRNEKDSVVLFLITFRDVTAYRQPVEEDLVANSALGAFAAASDAGSSWGRFARLVLSMVRQRNGSIGERSPGEARRDSTKSNELEPKEVCTGECADRGEIRAHTVITQTIQNVNNSRAGVDSEPPQDLKWSNKLAGAKLKRTKPEQGSSKEGNMHSIIGMEEGVVEDETKITKKRTLFRKLIEPGKTVINSFSNDAISLTSNSKWLGTTRNPGVNMDFEDYSTNHWLSSDAAPRYRLEPPCPPKHVILHYSAFRVIWDWTILLLTGYTAIVVPLRLVVIPRPNWVPLVKDLFTVGSWIRSSVPEALAIADAVIDIVFCLDIVLNFHTSFVGSGGEVVAEPPVIRTNYLRGWFTLDLLSCLPYELIKYFWPVNNHGIHSLLDGLRIIRLLRIGRAARRIDQYLEYVSTLLLLMILCFFLLAHWFACAWYAVGVLDLEHKIQYGWIPRYFNDSLRPQDWDQFMNLDDYLNSNLLPGEMYNQLLADKSGRVNMSRLVHLASTRLENVVEEETTLKGSVPLRNSVDKWSAYVTALYFSLSLLTTVGFGNVAAFTEAEKLLSICCMLIGALVYATIFGNITTIVQQLYATRTRYNEIMKGVKDFLRIHAVPQELGERVIDYITSSWSVNKGIDTAKVLNYCPKDMQADISVHLNRCVFNSHPAFRLASDGCRRSLAVNFQTLHTAPGDLIFHQGESVDQLCFIASGSLEVLQDDEVIAILGKKSNGFYLYHCYFLLADFVSVKHCMMLTIEL
ncbi:hypothetical protein EG68_01647 [Paragonimus skrjabini miyazakii]|uniref:Cyclic nucleotide-binding domain-containing protein n=1 Tax=Paragonimus skrjabini miyazakii TaxID=59628 RepID=A0A8S9Z7B9_9TREM|nr:hypothetical protein EG68_01647 [Paragonimus skrjabini miyazakii]